MFNERTERFMYSDQEYHLKLEHSLIAISSWEAKWKKPFLTEEQKTREEFVDYIKCMTINRGIPNSIYDFVTDEDIRNIEAYNNDPMTATWFTKRGDRPQHNRVITSELIYYMMIANNIPFECQKWHINRLITLIRVCENEQAPPKKMSQKEVMARYDAINKMNRAKYHSKG